MRLILEFLRYARIPQIITLFNECLLTLCVVSFRTGYGGVNCELEIDECLYDPPICLNGGECRNYEGSFGCLCLNFNGQYITGPFCEKVKEYCDIEEDPPACKNGGTCTSGTYNYECTCAPGFSGRSRAQNIWIILLAQLLEFCIFQNRFYSNVFVQDWQIQCKWLLYQCLWAHCPLNMLTLFLRIIKDIFTFRVIP